ncbi:MAG: bleomycin resistance protein [Sphingopyxis macrogoltabida]|uniref:Bleomycin resistance protein n=1 Tax=Sphingopyxis macrogoltabida TaxID=33050 RepID=A0A2W5N370_SPHMC|nr:MAG: bleomycin resistance protein [Sphingopyxis macrogoltabida]
MPINGIDAVYFGVEDIEKATQFFVDFGLEKVQESATQTSLETRDGGTVEIRAVDDASLPKAVTSGPTIREIVWGVEDEEALETIAAELSRDRAVERDADNGVHTTDDGGFGIAFRVARRRPASPAPNMLNIYGATPNRPMNVPVDFEKPIRPAAFAHVVIMTTDAEHAIKFYTERLGFRITDKFREGRGAFLRAPNSTYHHTMFIVQGPASGLHHVAFHVTDFNEIVMAGTRMLEKGWAPEMGPGRHIIGSNYFWYFKSPCGGAMELTADMDRADDDWQMREWTMSPRTGAAWITQFQPMPGG